MINKNKNFIPLFGNPLYLKQIENKKDEFLKKNLDLKTYLNLKNFKEVEITEITVKGLFYLNKILNSYTLKNDHKKLVVSLKRTPLDFFIKNRLYIFNTDYKNFFNIITLDSLNNNYIYKNTVESVNILRTLQNANVEKNSLKNIRQIYTEIKYTGEVVELEIENIVIQKKINILNLKIKALEIKNLALDRKNKFSYFTEKNLKNKIIKTKNNIKKIEHTIKNLVKSTNNFNFKKDTHSDSFLERNAQYQIENINQYIKSMTDFNMKRRGVLMVFSQTARYNFITERRNILKSIYKFLAASFYSLNCLISKPVFVITNDKVEIQLFYFLFKSHPQTGQYFYNKLKGKNNYLGVPISQPLPIRDIQNSVHSEYPLKGSEGEETNLVSKEFIESYKNPITDKSLSLLTRDQDSGTEENKVFKFIKLNYKLLKFRNNKIRILRKNFLIKNRLKFKQICDILSRFFNKNVELNLIRLHYPYNDGNILVNFLAINIRTMKIRLFLSSLFKVAVFKKPLNYKVSLVDNSKKKTVIIPAFLSGMKIRIAGRLMTQSVIPRKSVKTTFRGASSTGKINYTQVSRFTSKNKRGAYSITISSGQNFF